MFALIYWRGQNILSGRPKNRDCRDDDQMTTFQKVNCLQFLCSGQATTSFLLLLAFLTKIGPFFSWCVLDLMIELNSCLNNVRKQWNPIVYCQRIQTKTCCELCLGSQDHIVGDSVAVDLNACKLKIWSGKNLWT